MVLANETWRYSFLGRGNVIVVEYIGFEVVGASNWVWHKGGSWLEPKVSRRDSVLADETQGASVLGRRNLGGSRKRS